MMTTRSNKLSFAWRIKDHKGYFWAGTLKKRLAIFPSPAGMSLTKLYLAGKNLIIPGQGEFRYMYSSDIPAGDGEIANLF
jgi:hypothetical protein